MLDATKKLAVVTGASTGIGYELARQCVKNGFDLIIAANEPEIETAAAQLRSAGASETANADLSTTDGVDKLLAKINGRPVDALLANAGRGLGRAFLDQDWTDVRYVIDTNVTGTVCRHARRAASQNGLARHCEDVTPPTGSIERKSMWQMTATTR